jgi:mono/diheme cytochrome c family protein
MKTIPTIVASAAAIAASVLAIAGPASAGSTATNSSAPSGNSAGQIARGNYLVHRAGLCIDCHSPRNEKGEFIEDRHLTGSPIAFTPVAPMPWASFAPRLAGLPAGYTQEQIVHFLMTGERPDGRPGPLPPMPAYRFEREDAEAIVAYLKSLPAEASQR